MELQLQLFIVQLVHNFGPGAIGGVAYIMFLNTLGEATTTRLAISYIVLSALTGYVIYSFYDKGVTIIGGNVSKEGEIPRIVAGLGGFLHKYVIESVMKWIPKYFDKYAEKGLK